MKELELQAKIDNLNEIILQKDIKIRQLQEQITELLEYKKAYYNNFPN